MQNIFSAALKPIQNKVLVEIVGKYDTSVKLGNTIIEINRDYEREKFVSTVGIIRAVPSRLTFGKEANDLTWKTKMQIEVNDIAHMSFMAIAGAISTNGSSFTEGGKIFCFIHYRELVYVTRNGIDILLNGFCLLKPLQEELVPGFTKSIRVEIRKSFSNKFAEVIACGERNTQYVEENFYDDDIIKPKMIVAYLPIAGIKVYKSTQDLMTNTNVFLKVQRRFILAIMEPK